MMDNLQHKPVIVNPDLKADPLHMQGKIGHIASVNLQRDDFFVDFDTGLTGLYSSSALLVLRSHGQIYQQAMNRGQRLEKDEFKDLLRVSLLLQSGGHPHDAFNALKLILFSPKLLQLATQTLQDQLHLVPSADRKRNTDRVSGFDR